MIRSANWLVATGHADTSRAAASVLATGGNAFDAAIAAALAACMSEPIFCSIGGGGHALVKPARRAPLLLDFFTQTPAQRRLEGLDFYPITGNFGTDTQEFHVGMGAAAVPGVVAGLWALARRYGSCPPQRLVSPAIELARDGVVLNEVQQLALQILEPITRATDGSARLFGLDDRNAALPEPGLRLTNPELADCLEALAAGGPDAFYRGEIARRIAAQSAARGGHLGLSDLAGYRVHWRRPLRWTYRGATLWSNPPPAFGGVMVALTTRGLETYLPEHAGFCSPAHLTALCRAMSESEDLRCRLEQPEFMGSGRTLMAAYRTLPAPELTSSRGTTQISIIDGQGNGISLTLSNGEGCGRVVPGLGFMLNNMLGEQDINRAGFHRWPLNSRLASMMAPSMLELNGERAFLGTGGSNRIRTALAQVVSNRVDFGMDLQAAIEAPRLHLEAGRLALEPPREPGAAEVRGWVREHFPDAREWPGRNLFFGGVHAVAAAGQAVAATGQAAAAGQVTAAAGQAVADPRRQGAALRG